MIPFKPLKPLLLSLIFFTALSGVVTGQENPEQWTIQECVDYAIKNNIDLKQSGLDVRASQVELTRSRADLFPTLNAQSRYSHNVGRTADQTTYQIVDDKFSSQSINLGSSITLFNGLRKINTIKQNKIDHQISTLNYEATRNDVVLNLINYYINILFNQELLDNALLRLETSKLQVERTAKLVEAGSLARASLLELQAQKAGDELEVVNARNQLELSRLNLKQAMQLPIDQEFEIVVPDLPEPDEAPYPEEVDFVYKEALLTQPQIESAELQIESAEYGISIAKGNRLPSISGNLFIGSQYSSVFPLDAYSSYWEQIDFNLNRGFAISLDIPIFNGWQVKSAVSQAKINQENAELMAISAKNELRQIIEQSYLDVVAAAKSYAASKEQVRSLQEAFRSTETRFNLGVINAVDYNLTKQNLAVAESELTRAKYDYIFKTKILDFFQGKPITF